MKVKFLNGRSEEFETLAGANLRRANLWGTDLTHTDLVDADLRGADLQGANLRDADLRCTNLRGADMRGAEFESGVVCLGALVGAVLDKEQYASLRDILDKVGETVDDEGTRAQVLRDKEIRRHYEHAKETHPVFADILSTGGSTLGAKHYKAHLRARHEAGECTPMDVLWGEYLEVLEAIDARDKAQAVYECYDCIAVLLRLIDMIEETAEKEGWKEVRG